MRKILVAILIVAGMPTLATAQAGSYKPEFGFLDVKGVNVKPRLLDLRQIDVYGHTMAKVPVVLRKSNTSPYALMESDLYYRLSFTPKEKGETIWIKFGDGDNAQYKAIITEPYDFVLEQHQTVHIRIVSAADSKRLAPVQ